MQSGTLRADCDCLHGRKTLDPIFLISRAIDCGVAAGERPIWAQRLEARRRRLFASRETSAQSGVLTNVKVVLTARLDSVGGLRREAQIVSLHCAFRQYCDGNNGTLFLNFREQVQMPVTAGHESSAKSICKQHVRMAT